VEPVVARRGDDAVGTDERELLDAAAGHLARYLEPTAG
jgi:hypothetical protein